MRKYWFAKLKRRLTRHRSFVRAILVTTILGLFIFSLYSTVPLMLSLIKGLIRGPATAFSLVKDPQGVLRSTKGRSNILLLGMGGSNHKGANLTDSIILISLDLSSADTVLLSIPRDIWIDSLKTKINSTYYFGEQQKEGGGLILIKAAVEEVIGQPVHYAISIDFDGFKRAVDLVGGLDIVVPEIFNDYKYPIPGMEEAEPEELRYEHFRVDAGLQKMSGERALKYVRSRNAEGPQGTDFARSRRQQQVLTAFKSKVISLETILSPSRIKELAQTFSDSITTDMTESEYISLAKLAIKARNETIRSGILEEEDKEIGREGLLVNPSPGKYQNQWVLVGRNESWYQVHEYVESLFYQKPIAD